MSRKGTANGMETDETLVAIDLITVLTAIGRTSPLALLTDLNQAMVPMGGMQSLIQRLTDEVSLFGDRAHRDVREMRVLRSNDALRGVDVDVAGVTEETTIALNQRLTRPVIWLPQ
jgi:hypothetical protein